MSALGSILRRSLENPNTPISSAEIGAFGVFNDAVVPVSEERAYGLTSYYRAISLISSTIAALPLKVYQRDTRELAAQDIPVLREPNPSQTRFEYRQTMIANALSWGNAFSFKQRDRTPNRDVVATWPIHPSKVRVEVDLPTDDNPSGKLFHVQTSTGERVLTDYEIFHLPYLSVNGYQGLPPLAMHRQALGVAVSAENTAASFYGKGSLMSGVLGTDAKLDADQADRIQRRWQQRVAGQANAGQIAVLDAGLKFMPISIPPEDAELLASRRFGVEEIARLFGVPPHLIGAVERSTSWGSGIEQQFIGWVQTSLNGWITLIEQRINRELLPGGTFSPLYAEFTLEGLLRGDSAARAQFYAQAIQWGWMNRNEVRVRENLQPADGLDEFLAPLNMAASSDFANGEDQEDNSDGDLAG